MWLKPLLIAGYTLVQSFPGGGYGQHPYSNQSDPYTGWTNPITGEACCHGVHCRPIRGDEVIEGDLYFQYRGMRIMKYEVEGSFNGQWHACIDGGRIICMRAPFNW